MKTETPVSSMRLRPKRSQATADSMRVAPETIVYELSTHDSCAADTSGNDRRKSGKATLMIDWFSDEMKLHIDARTITIHV